MAVDLAISTKNAMLDAIETDWGTAVRVKIRTGTKPAAIGDASAGTVLVDMTLPSDYFAAAASGAKAKLGTWEDASADDTGTAGHFEIFKSDNTTLVARGTVTATSGGGDLELDNTSITSGQSVTISTFTLNAGN